ncbi:major facilitator superfamily transporter [Apiospora marii]|uniref:Major facilitator superfamily transporter n=1 Tax=Apiospora marii TaxID=335849 RepID=A0ABR1SRM4_9PEZI
MMTETTGHAPTTGPSTWAIFYRGVLFQMILFGALSFVGPAMGDALSNLGGGGFSTPWLANIANCLSYAGSFMVTILGGPLINKIGIKWSCFIAAVAMPLQGSAFYVSARYNVDWYLLFGNIVQGITGGFLYVGESTAMLSYPHPDKRGLSGSLLGGAINFSNNHKTATSGGVAWSTYLIFVAFECTGVIFALLLSPTRKVRRHDGSRVQMSEKLTWKQEFSMLYRALRNKKIHMPAFLCSPRQILAMFLPSFFSFFYGGTMGTYLSLHFSVRSRALSSLLVRKSASPGLLRCFILTAAAIFTISSVLAFGKLLDGNLATQKRRAYVCCMMWILPIAAGFIWIGIEYSRLGPKSSLDYANDTASWARAYIPYLMVFVAGYWTQLSLYWILGNFSLEVGSSARTGGLFRAFETAGQAVSYGLSSSASVGGLVPFYVNCGLFVLVLPCIWWLIQLMPDVALTVGVEPEDPTAGKDIEDGKIKDVDVKKL